MRFHYGIIQVHLCNRGGNLTYILFIVFLRQMKMAVVSSSLFLKTFMDGMAKEDLGQDSITTSFRHSTSWTNTTIPNPPSPTRRLDKVFDFLGKLLVVLGLLPGGTEGPKQSLASILKICLAAVLVGFLSSTYIILQCKGSRLSGSPYLHLSFSS